MRAWRLFKTCHADSAHTGLGAKLAGGRWNSPGRSVVYAATTLSLAILEIMVNLHDFSVLKESFSYCSLDFPEEVVSRISAEELPEDWRRPFHPGLKAMGDRWLTEGRSAVLEVPSAVVPIEINYLLNPEHEAFPTIIWGSAVRFAFDARFSKGL